MTDQVDLLSQCLYYIMTDQADILSTYIMTDQLDLLSLLYYDRPGRYTVTIILKQTS